MFIGYCHADAGTTRRITALREEGRIEEGSLEVVVDGDGVEPHAYVVARWIERPGEPYIAAPPRVLAALHHAPRAQFADFARCIEGRYIPVGATPLLPREVIRHHVAADRETDRYGGFAPEIVALIAEAAMHDADTMFPAGRIEAVRAAHRAIDRGVAVVAATARDWADADDIAALRRAVENYIARND